MTKLTVASVQLNSVVGDLSGNTSRIKEAVAFAGEKGADLVVFPELAITGYPPEDLVFNPQFVTENLLCLQDIAKVTSEVAVVLGFVDQDKKGNIYNAAALLANGSKEFVYHKLILPNYGVFDEKRYFQPGIKAEVRELKNIKFGINICEDIWDDSGPIKSQAVAGAKMILNINGSPYHIGKYSTRESMLIERATSNNIAIVYLNMVGGQDELVFDGGSMVVDSDGTVVIRGNQFQQEFTLFEITEENEQQAGSGVDIVSRETFTFDGRLEDSIGTSIFPVMHVPSVEHNHLAELYAALVLGIRDYVLKNRFTKVVIGLSGGIDSALTAVLAVDAVGKDNVMVISMPSRYSSEGSITDAKELAKNLGLKLNVLPIELMYKEYLSSLDELFQGTVFNTAEENIQARIRGTLLMALSNKFGWLVLTTGNKSEMGMGYATLYGDMAGGFAVLKDVLKTQVYELCKYRNSLSERKLISNAILVKPPSAELRFDQRDQDTLPPYEILDPILKAYVEQDQPFHEIVASGYDPNDVRMVIGAVERSEYNRRQSPPGIKVTPRAFGRDWRFPISNRYKSS